MIEMRIKVFYVILSVYKLQLKIIWSSNAGLTLISALGDQWGVLSPPQASTMKSMSCLHVLGWKCCPHSCGILHGSLAPTWNTFNFSWRLWFQPVLSIADYTWFWVKDSFLWHSGSLLAMFQCLIWDIFSEFQESVLLTEECKFLATDSAEIF